MAIKEVAIVPVPIYPSGHGHVGAFPQLVVCYGVAYHAVLVFDEPFLAVLPQGQVEFVIFFHVLPDLPGPAVLTKTGEQPDFLATFVAGRLFRWHVIPLGYAYRC